MGRPWIAHGWPLSGRWVTDGYPWATHRWCMGCAWVTHGSPTDDPWVGSDSPWVPHQPLMGFPWVAHRSAMAHHGSLTAHNGSLMEKYQKMTGGRNGKRTPGIRTSMSKFASTKASTETSTKNKASTEVLPRIQKLPRKYFHGFSGFSSTMEASGCFHGKSEAQRLPRKLPQKLFVKAFEVASTKSWKLHPSTEFCVSLPWKLPQLPRNLSGFHDSSHGYICIGHYCASSRAHRLFDNMVVAHCVRGEGNFTVQWLLRFIGLGLRLGLGYIYLI